MKKVLSVVALFAVILFVGCDLKEKTFADYLTQQTKGWVLTAATSDPAYIMKNGERVTDLYNGGYLTAWEKEYVLIFQENGNVIVKPGKTVAPSAEDGYTAETNIGNWIINNVDGMDLLNCQIPFFMDEDVEVCRIVSLDNKKMELNCTINDDTPASKGTYTFRLTYEPAK